MLFQMSKYHPKQIFLISGNVEDKKKQCYACVKFVQRNIFNAYIQFRTLYRNIRDFFFKNYLEAKPMHVFQLDLQYQKALSDL